MFKLRRRQGESQIVSNQNSAVKIASWFAKAGKRMAYHRVLQLLYKSAWTEVFSPCSFQQNPLKAARQFGDCAWWSLLLVESQKDTKLRHGFRHRSAGQQCFSWEQPFILAFDEAWRGKLAHCRSLAEWMRGCDHCIDTTYLQSLFPTWLTSPGAEATTRISNQGTDIY